MFRRLTVVATATLLGAPMLAVTSAHAADDVTINLIGINDFHGRIDANTVQFAGTVEALRAENPTSSLLISAGDNVSASLFASSVQKDIPTIDVLNALDLDASAAGNHEFDQGADDLTGRLSDAADFPFLSANTFKADKTPLLKKYELFTVDGVDIAVIGAVTEETPSLVSPAGIQGLTFADPVDSINDTVDEIEALPAPQQPDVIVASIHEGAPDGSKTLEQNATSSPVFKKVVEQTDPAVDAIFMGHTHQAYAYDAPIPGQAGKTRPVLQTGNYGTNVGQIKLTFDPDTGEVTGHTKKNQARTTTAAGELTTSYPRVAEVKTITDAALAYAAEVGSKPVGSQTADITRAYTGNTENRGAESTLSNLIAESLRASVSRTPAGADIGLNNPGGVRADLLYAAGAAPDAPGTILFSEALNVLTFANQLSTVTLSGSSLKKVFEQQWQRNADGSVPTRAYLQLGMSKNLTYTFDSTRPEGDRITSITINGKVVQPTDSFKVAVPSFLTSGGDNFRAFTEGTAVDSGVVDYTGFNDYIAANSPITPDFSAHAVEVTGVKSSYKALDTVSVTLPKLDLTSRNSPANTTVAATLTYGGKTVDLGAFPVAAGSSTVTFDLPAGAVGGVTLTATAAPTNTSVSIPLSVEKIVSTTTGTAPAKAKTGTTFTVEAAVASAAGSAVTPTGTVSVKEGDTVLGSAALTDGKASVAVNASKLSADEHALTVSYSGDGVHAASTASAGTIEIVKGGSGFGAVAAPGTYGTPTTVKVSADPEASGLVYVTEGGRAIGLGFLRAGTGTVTLDGTALAPGTHSLAVYFGGDEKFDPTSTTASLTIAKAPTKLKKVSVSPSKIVVKRTKAFVTLSVKATGFTVDGGKVTLRQSGKNYSGTVRNGKVRIRLAKFTSKGSAKKITATYGGNKLAEGSSTTFTVKVRSK
nr:5'-nucleotidase C-terminal domain-containing protein [Aeromicrobium wangtongii]